MTAGAPPESSRTAHERRVLVVAVLASFVAILDGSVVSLALPAIGREFGGGLLAQQWIVDAYLLTLGSLILVAGALSDLFGRVRVLHWGLVGFAVTSVLCGFAPTAVVLILARGLQGMAGALLVPSSLALIISEFSGAAQSRAIGQWTAWTGASIIVSPLVGGLSVDLWSWRLVFFINLVPVAVAVPVLARLRNEAATDRRYGRIDWPGAVLAVAGLGGPVFALIQQGSFGWRNPLVWVPLAAGCLALAGFLLRERQALVPMMPLDLFRVRNFWVGNCATFVVYGAMSLGFFVLGLYLQQVGGLSATAAGLALLPSTILLLLLSSFFGRLSGRLGPRFFMAVGPAVAGVGFLMLLSMRAELDYARQVLPGILVFGLGLAVTVAPLTAAILGSVGAATAGIGSAVNNAVARVAGLVTVAFAGVVVGPSLDLDALHRADLVTAVLLLVGALVSALGIRNPATQLSG